LCVLWRRILVLVSSLVMMPGTRSQKSCVCVCVEEDTCVCVCVCVCVAAHYAPSWALPFENV
jgi:hypothetical protein